MAVTNIPNVQNWTVTPQNGQAGYFTLMNTWLGQSTLVIASLQTAIDAQNAANEEINALAIQTENNAIVANGLANFQGAWNNSTPYLKGQSVESTTGSKIYYISKQDNNLNHSVTDTNYWVYNPINDKVNNSGNETISGIKTFTLSPVVPIPTTTGNVITMDNIIQKTAVGIGYGAGAGGTVTQLTSKNTDVTLNKPTGRIIMNNAALGAGASAAFVLNNTLAGANDMCMVQIVNLISNDITNYKLEVSTYYIQGFYITLTNKSGSTLSESIQIQFTIIKGASA